MTRWCAVFAVGCVGKTASSPSTSDSSPGTEDSTGSPIDSATACGGYYSTAGAAVPVDPPIRTGPITDQCLVSEPATIDAWCAQDATWTAAWGGCPTLSQLTAAVVPGSYVTTPLGCPIGTARVYDCVLAGQHWAILENLPACYDVGTEYILFDPAESLTASAYDLTYAHWYTSVCCGGTYTTQEWVAGVPPNGLVCTLTAAIDAYWGISTGGSGSTTTTTGGSGG